MAFFELAEENMFREDIGHYISYGIRTDDGEILSDISDDRKTVSELISRLNAASLEKIQLEEVIDDFLGTGGELSI